MLSPMIADVDYLEVRLSDPTPAAVAALAAVRGDVLILGAGGKMGPTLARMARRAAGDGRRVIAVSRFSDERAEAGLRAHGVETVRFDLLDFARLGQLPDAPNVIFMTGMKFGSSSDPALTWAMNVLLPARVMERYAGSRVVAFSTGNVYGLTPVSGGGSLETDAPRPIGEYAMSTLGRERALEYAAKVHKSPLAILRLNYASELRYGVLVDVARAVWEGGAIDLTMGTFNAIWQGDANAIALACLTHVASPPLVLNLAGPETLSVRQLATAFGEIFGKTPRLEGVESPDALLSNSQRCVRLFGYPRVGVHQMIEWVADWVRRGGPSLGKPTHFENRAGEY
jgi:nucleoside-diphosphate-sugar epimerase